MRFGVLAIDYDGTIADNGVMPPEVRDALGGVRRAGVVVVVVTGRILSELRRVAGDIDFADAVVAENGAVLSFPSSGRTVTLHRPTDPAFAAALRAKGVDVVEGECVVEIAADAARVALDVLRRMELPLSLAFNRHRVMVLPQAISKATGLWQVLQTLRLSRHNTLAIGDAENDHELLAAAEVGVAVRWGSDALQRAADIVLEGSGPADVAGFLRSLIAQRDLPPTAGRRRLLLGQKADGTPLALAVRDRNVLITGDPRSGKSWVAGLLTEQLMLAQYCVCVVDPEGDYRTLESLPGVRVMGDTAPPTPGELERAFRFPDASVIVDLSHVPHPRKLDYMRSLLPTLVTLRTHTGLPHRIVIDEAHYFLREPNSGRNLDVARGGYTFVTYRPSELSDDVICQMGVIIGTRHSDPREADALARACRVPIDSATLAETLGTLSVSEAVLLPGAAEAGDGVVRVKVAPRLTSHVRHRSKYADLPVASWQSFVFSRAPGQPAALSLAGFSTILGQLELGSIDHHLRHHDFSRWLSDVFGDRTLARDVADVEEAYAVGHSADAAGAVVAAITRRYDVKGEPTK